MRGAEALADTVRVMLGPKSNCVLIGKKWGRPLVFNDGVIIPKEVEMMSERISHAGVSKTTKASIE
jgi:chaperonin GroEL